MTVDAVAKLKLDELFVTWLSLPETRASLENALSDITNNRPIHQSPAAGKAGDLHVATSSLGVETAGMQSPLSPPHHPLPTPHHEAQAPASPRGAATAAVTVSSADGGSGPASGLAAVANQTLDASPVTAQSLSPASIQGGAAGGGPLSPRSPQQALAGHHMMVSPPAPRSPSGIRGRGGDANMRSPSSSAARNLSLGGDGAVRKGAGASTEVIPRFYFPGGRKPKTAEEIEAERVQVLQAFGGSESGELKLEELMPVTKDVCELPSYFNPVLFARLEKGGTVSHAAFSAFWKEQMHNEDLSTRAFRVLKQDGNDFLVAADWKVVVNEILLTHPGLEFLESTPEFQEKYAETVVVRIYYTVNRAGNGRLTLREMKRSNLMNTMVLLDKEPDINKVLDFFSYEHFYVLYCKFWELDTNHDHVIDKEDLLRYANYSLTFRIVDRIFDEIPRKMVCQTPGKMCYEDFIWFLLSEEDKETPTALEYWFRCVDLDGDGAITPTEMRYFYQEQVHRMECISQEVVQFEDVLCQISDMIHPSVEGRFTMRDLRKSGHAATFFNILTNLSKLIAHENRDPFVMRQEQALGATPWERFARVEYDQMALEDDADAEGAAGGEWDYAQGGGGASESPF